MAYLKDRSNFKAVETFEALVDRRRGGKQGVWGTEQNKIPVTVPEQLVLITAASKTGVIRGQRQGAGYVGAPVRMIYQDSSDL